MQDKAAELVNRLIELLAEEPDQAIRQRAVELLLVTFAVGARSEDISVLVVNGICKQALQLVKQVYEERVLEDDAGARLQ
jgi:hypothetical protein